MGRISVTIDGVRDFGRHEGAKGSMELRHLRYFITVAEELHFGRAAQRLHIAQPALSQQIRQLEEMLGFPLFDRDKHQVELTAPGRVFLDEARLILIQLQRACDIAERVHVGASGRLIIGFVGSATYHIIPLLRAYREQYPLVHIVLQQMKTLEQLQALHEKRIDIGLIRPIRTNPDISQAVIHHEALMVALPDHHPLAAKETISMSDLTNEPFIMTPIRPGSSYYEVVMQYCHDADFKPNIVLEAPEFLTIVAFVAHGMGIALVPESFWQQQNIGVIYRKIEAAKPLLELAVAWRTSATSQVVQEFISTQTRNPEDRS